MKGIRMIGNTVPPHRYRSITIPDEESRNHSLHPEVKFSSTSKHKVDAMQSLHIRYVPTRLHIDDLLTKDLPVARFDYIRSRFHVDTAV
ncbi:hypothetical protein L1987_16144 [Smallanthus sonchifolius]|uniref:Uncharacterized protein n=1 Tax=Smallanthus sonchifolius TaxID=185202 RepID=A0ACB9J9M1_9ASTR|nr:hypothetical protein L1987_16144 [Smallanthus sonchifolius]